MAAAPSSGRSDGAAALRGREPAVALLDRRRRRRSASRSGSRTARARAWPRSGGPSAARCSSTSRRSTGATAGRPPDSKRPSPSSRSCDVARLGLLRPACRAAAGSPGRPTSRPRPRAADRCRSARATSPASVSSSRRISCETVCACGQPSVGLAALRGHDQLEQDHGHRDHRDDHDDHEEEPETAPEARSAELKWAHRGCPKARSLRTTSWQLQSLVHGAGLKTCLTPPSLGAIAQLGERLDRTQEVGGSSPPSSISPDGRGLERRRTRRPIAALPAWVRSPDPSTRGVTAGSPK